MGYSNTYGMSGTSDDDWKKELKKCREKMSCTAGRCMSYNHVGNRCTCVPCDIDISARGRYTPGGYGNIIRSRSLNGLGETAAQERARHKKNIAKCDASCASNPIAAICRAEGRTVKADHCDIDTGINEYGCSCGKPIVTGSGVMTTSANRSYGGYGNIIRSQGVNGLNESFLESLGSLGNLAIIGLAIYGGFCLAKKL